MQLFSSLTNFISLIVYKILLVHKTCMLNMQSWNSFRYSKTNVRRKIDFEDEEERKIQEGAETLLNLAGISTRKRYNSQSIDYTHKRRKSNNQFVVPDAAYEKPTQFRPRLLRTKKKDKISHNNNNNNTLQVEDEWVKHRRELEEGQKR